MSPCTSWTLLVNKENKHQCRISPLFFFYSSNIFKKKKPARQEDKEQLETEIRKAHVICIVYAIDNPTTFHGISKYWLPLIRSLGVKVKLIMDFKVQLFTFSKGACHFGWQ
jgi:hypothetical protein